MFVAIIDNVVFKNYKCVCDKRNIHGPKLLDREMPLWLIIAKAE